MRKIVRLLILFVILSAPVNTFAVTDNGNGTVSDLRTELMWEKSATRSVTWQESLDYCNGLALAGYDNWRLPNIRELESLMDLATSESIVEPGSSPETYWSSTTMEFDPISAWTVLFGYNTAGGSKSNNYSARCVRSDHKQEQQKIPIRYEFTEILTGGPWSFGQEAAGMAVGLDETIYLANGDTLWQVKDGVPSVYLGPSHGIFNFTDVDIDSNGLLYIFDDEIVGGQILTSTQEGTYSVYRNVSDLTFPHFMAVVKSNLIALTSRQGLSIVTEEGTSLAHDSSVFYGSSDCATEDLAIQRSGAFSYQEGCNGTAMVLGDVNFGIPRVVRLEDSELPYTHWATGCTTRNPLGGFISIMFFDTFNTIQLVQFSEDVGNTTGWNIIETNPTIDEVRGASSETFSFRFCAIAASQSGKIYYQTYSQLWVFTPVYE